MTAKEIIQLLPTRAPEQLKLFTETNRPITGRHLDSIETFLKDTPNWAMPSITLAVTPGQVTSKTGSIEVDSYDLQILDGQHRIQAFSNVIHELEINVPGDQSNGFQERLNQIVNQEIPVIIFEVASKQDQRQIFAWFARSKPIEPAVREFFDESDPFNKAAKAAMDTSKVLDDRVTYETKTIPPKGRHLLSLSNLKDITTTIQIGIRRAPKIDDREARWQPDTQAALKDRTMEFFDDFRPTCLPNYQLLTHLEEFHGKILFERSLSYALNPMIIRLMANVWARWTMDYEERPEKLAQYIGRLKLRRADPLNDAETSLSVVQGPKKRMQGLRDKSWEEATTRIITAARG